MVHGRSVGESECPEETTVRSVGSPGPVLDEEELGRFLFRDDHLTADGDLTPAALPTSDLLDPQRAGISVGRLDHLNADDILGVVAARQRRTPTDKLHGCGVAVTAAVRCMRARDGRRELCVVDDALDGFEAHALVRLANPDAYTKGSVRRLRERLLDLFSFRPARVLLDSL